jgi:hypothetical protein
LDASWARDTGRLTVVSARRGGQESWRNDERITVVSEVPGNVTAADLDDLVERMWEAGQDAVEGEELRAAFARLDELPPVQAPGSSASSSSPLCVTAGRYWPGGSSGGAVDCRICFVK